MNVLAIFSIALILGVLGQLSLKMGVSEIGKIEIVDIFSLKIFKIIFQKYIFLGICLYTLSTFFWLIALSRSELSYLYPLMGISFILVAILSKLIFNESLTFFRFLGVIFISIGAFLIILRM